MSCLPPRADINGCIFDVRFVPKADINRVRRTSSSVSSFAAEASKFDSDQTPRLVGADNGFRRFGS
jgi:hypothetical protein